MYSIYVRATKLRRMRSRVSQMGHSSFKFLTEQWRSKWCRLQHEVTRILHILLRCHVTRYRQKNVVFTYYTYDKVNLRIFGPTSSVHVIT